MQTLLEQALSQRLMEEFNSNIQLRMQLIDAQAKIKELEDAQQQSGTPPDNDSQRSDKRAGNSGGKSSVVPESRAESHG